MYNFSINHLVMDYCLNICVDSGNLSRNISMYILRTFGSKSNRLVQFYLNTFSIELIHGPCRVVFLVFGSKLLIKSFIVMLLGINSQESHDTHTQCRTGYGAV